MEKMYLWRRKRLQISNMNMRLAFLAMLLAASALAAEAQPWSFRFATDKKVRLPEATQVLTTDRYSASTDYGFDFVASPTSTDAPTPFFFSLRVPDGNYRVTVLLGSNRRAASTTVRAESRRLFVENLNDTLSSLDGHREHNIDHGYHHEGHEDHEAVCHEC